MIPYRRSWRCEFRGAVTKLLPPFPPPASRICAVCSRPVRPQALVCTYCGEDLPQRRQRFYRRAGSAAAAFFSTAAFAAVHGWHALPETLTLAGSVLLALGAGLALLPPALRGVADSTRRERLWQTAPRYFGGMALALLTAGAMLAACAPQKWTIGDAPLAGMTALALLAAPVTLNLPWHKLLAGTLMAAGLLLSQ